MSKHDLGWSPCWDHLVQTRAPNSVARISAKHRTNCEAIRKDGERIICYVRNRVPHDNDSSTLPAVGDWCVLGDTFVDQSNRRACFIEEVLPRRSKLSRMAAGIETAEQVLAANVDIVFIVTSANTEFNVARLRRYVILALNGQCKPIILVSKIDLLDGQASDVLSEVNHAFPNVQCIVTSSIADSGIEQLRSLLKRGVTALFVGSSGVGKSSLVNKLLARTTQRVHSIRESDERGRHTTTGGRMFFVANGGMIIDTPGLKEVGLVADEHWLQEVMPSVPEVAQSCRFTDCTHTIEPGCAVTSAVAEGMLPEEDVRAYNKLQREVAYNKRKFDQRLAAQEKNRWKQIAIFQKRNRSRGR